LSKKPAQLAACWFLAGLFSDPENGGDMFLRNVGWLSTDYTALYPRRFLHNHRRENLKSYIVKELRVA
jgi:hypothetical protein